MHFAKRRLNGVFCTKNAEKRTLKNALFCPKRGVWDKFSRELDKCGRARSEYSTFWRREIDLHKAVICRHALPAPEALKGLKLAFISDIHIAGYYKPDEARVLIGQIASLGADMILWGGDFAETLEYQRAFFPLLASLKPHLGSFAVMGNNDRECFGNSFPLMRSLARKNGVRLLINEQAAVPYGGGRILIGGLDEWKYGQPNAKGMFRGAGENDLRVLLSHYPHVADKAVVQAALPPHIYLSGHTHGGQLALGSFSCYNLGYGYKYARRSRHFFVSGWREFDEPLPGGRTMRMRMLVSNGIGESLFPLRLNAPRQVHLIELV